MQIEVKELRKVYGETPVLEDISFNIAQGEIVGFLGPNGAGKTTTMRIITGFLSPTSGAVSIGGMSILEHPIETRKKIGYLPENNPLYPDLKVFEYLEFFAKAKGIFEFQKEVRRVILVCGLRERVNQLISELSKGYRQRVGLAQALLGNPEVIILDEPTSGLDPNQVVEIRNLIKEIGKSKTIILSTHVLSEVEVTCTQTIIINKGKIVASGNTKELLKQFQGKTLIKFSLSRQDQDMEMAIRAMPGALSLLFVRSEGEENEYLLETRENIDLRKDISRLCAQRDILLLNMEYKTKSLEDIFHELTQ